MNQLATVDLATGEIVSGDLIARAAGAKFRKAHATHVDSVRLLIEVGELLKQKKESLSHGEWLPWLEENREALGFGRHTAQRLLKATGLAKGASTLLLELAPAEALKINRQIWGNHNHRAQGTGENEWYTPRIYIEAARAVLSAIDLDPASSEHAQETVKAAEFFTEATNGLEQPWHGRVWLNPPYAQPLIQQFIEKLCVEYGAGRVSAAILLTHNYTDTEWFHIAAKACAAVCFTRGRVKFINPEGQEAAPTQGQAFFYFGDDVQAFAEEFSVFGIVFQRYEF